MNTFPVHIWELIVSDIPFNGNTALTCKYLLRVVKTIETDRRLRRESDQDKGFLLISLYEKYWFDIPFIREIGWLIDDADRISELKKKCNIFIRGWKEIIEKSISTARSGYMQSLNIMNLILFEEFILFEQYLFGYLHNNSRESDREGYNLIGKFFEGLLKAGMVDRIIQTADTITRFGYVTKASDLVNNLVSAKPAESGLTDFRVDVIVNGNPVLMEYFIDYRIVETKDGANQFWFRFLDKASWDGRWDLIQIALDNGKKYSRYHLGALISGGFPDLVLRVINEQLIDDEFDVAMTMLLCCHINLKDRTLECNGVVVGSLDSYLRVRSSRDLPFMSRASVDQITEVYRHYGLKRITEHMIYELASQLFIHRDVNVFKRLVIVLKDLYVVDTDKQKKDRQRNWGSRSHDGDEPEVGLRENILDPIPAGKEPTIVTALKSKCGRNGSEIKEKYFHAWLENWEANVKNEFGV
jgi:hypothetical protein